jgi:hypothetical protein
MKAPIRNEIDVKSEKLAAALRACSAASAVTVTSAPPVVATSVAEPRTENIAAINTVAKAHAKKPWAVLRKKLRQFEYQPIWYEGGLLDTRQARRQATELRLVR